MDTAESRSSGWWLGGVGPASGLQSQSVTTVTVTMSQVGTGWWGTESPAEANCVLKSQQNVDIHRYECRGMLLSFLPMNIHDHA